MTPSAPVTVPGAPGGVSASAGIALATVRFTAPGDGGSQITSYSASCTPVGGGAAVSASASAPAPQVVVSGLTIGVNYTCTVKATNAVGTGPLSAASNAVKPISIMQILPLLLSD